MSRAEVLVIASLILPVWGTRSDLNSTSAYPNSLIIRNYELAIDPIGERIRLVLIVIELNIQIPMYPVVAFSF